MKNALILHGTSGSPEGNWFAWLKTELEKIGYTVWLPQLPNCDRPNVHTYNEFLLNQGWEFNSESIIIGHSSGSVEILSLLQHLPEGIKVGSCYLVGSFKDNLGRDELSDLFLEPFDFTLIKQRAAKFVFLHSDNDPYCPLEHAEYLSQQTGGELIVVPGQGHFSIGTVGPQYKEFPLLLELIKKNV